MTDPQQHPAQDQPPADTAPPSVDERDAADTFTTIVMLGSIDLLEKLAPNQATTRFDRFDATNARDYWLFRTLLDIQKAGTAMTRWREYAAARKLKPEDGATAYDALALEALIAEQSLWQRRLGESLFRLICFSTTNEPEYYEHLLRLTELEQLLCRHRHRRVPKSPRSPGSARPPVGGRMEFGAAASASARPPIVSGLVSAGSESRQEGSR